MSPNPSGSPLYLAVDCQYHRDTQLPAALRRADLDDAYYTAVTLDYELTRRVAALPWLRSAYVTVADGRLPPARTARTLVYVGVRLGRRLP